MSSIQRRRGKSDTTRRNSQLDNRRSNKADKKREQRKKWWWVFISLMILIFIASTIFCLCFRSTPQTSTPVLKQKHRIIPDVHEPLPPSSTILKTFQHAAVSSDSQECSTIASDILKTGNIFDSTIAAVICLSLTQPQSMGLAGGFLMNVYLKRENRFLTIDAQPSAPELLDFTQSHNQGPFSIAVPGVLKGLLEVYEQFASLPLSELVHPTISLCKKGILLTKHIYDSLHINKNIVNDGYLKETFQENGKFKKPGSFVHLKKHCDFLEILIENSENLYDKICHLIAEDLKELGSKISEKDLKNYKVKWKDSLKFDIGKDKELLVPDTAIMLPLILNILKGYNFTEDFKTEEDFHKTVTSYHRVLEAFKHAFSIRAQMGDPDFVDMKRLTEKVLSEDFASKIRSKIDDTQTFENLKIYNFKNLTTRTHFGTTHLSIIDSEGNACSLTSSINFYFGSGVTGNRTGLIFNNAMDDFSYPNRELNYFGLYETPTNFPEPFKRPLSSMTPAIIVNKLTNEVELVLGAAGGSKIISTLALSIIRYFWLHQDLKEIVDAPRLHHQLIPNHVEYEYGILEKVLRELNRKKHKLKRFENRGTILVALSKQDDTVFAVNDYRKDSSGVSGY